MTLVGLPGMWVAMSTLVACIRCPRWAQLFASGWAHCRCGAVWHDRPLT